jgi:hypothetical protein
LWCRLAPSRASIADLNPKQRETFLQCLIMPGAKALVPPPMHSFWLGWEGAVPTYGLSDREMAKTDQTIEIVLPVAQKALARGDIGFLKWEIDELLKLFRISLDPKCSSYRELGQAVLKANR